MAHHAVGQQTGHPQAQHHAQHLGHRRQRRQRGLAQRQPHEEGRAFEQIQQPLLQPLQHLAQAKGHGGGKEQRPGPQCQQNHGAAAVLAQPVGAKGAPARQRAQPLQQQRHQRPQQGAARIEHQVQVGGNTPRQVDLQELHGQRQQGACQRRQRHGRARAAAAHQGQRQEKAQRRVADDIDVDVEPGPVRRRDLCRQEDQRINALGAPAIERKQAGENDEHRIDQRQRPGRSLLHHALPPSSLDRFLRKV